MLQEATKGKIRELACLFLKFAGLYEIKEEVSQEQVDNKFREVILSAFPNTTEGELELSRNAYKHCLDNYIQKYEEEKGKILITELEFKSVIDEKINELEKALDILMYFNSTSNQDKVTSEVTCH